MKKIRIMMTMAAFAVAVAGAVASHALTPPSDVFVFTPEGACAEVAVELPSGCNSSGGNVACTVYVPDYGTSMATYAVQWNPAECLFPYVRW